MQGKEMIYENSYRFDETDGSVMYLQTRADWDNQDLENEIMGMSMDMPDDGRGINFLDMTMAIVNFDLDDMVMDMKMQDYSKYQTRENVPSYKSDIDWVNGAVDVDGSTFPRALFTTDRCDLRWHSLTPWFFCIPFPDGFGPMALWITV